MRNPKIEAILAAWFEALHGEPSSRDTALRDLNALLDEIVTKDPRLSRHSIKSALTEQFNSYRQARRQEEDIIRKRVR
jgi:hypothetical protein